MSLGENAECYVCGYAKLCFRRSDVPICEYCDSVWFAPPRRTRPAEQLEIDIPMPRITAPMAQRTCTARFVGPAFSHARWCGVHAKAAGIDDVPTCELHECDDRACKC